MKQESSWDECLESGSAFTITIDKAKARSLIETAKKRLYYANNVSKQNQDMNFVFESGYTSLAELFHALLLLKGYKVLSHIGIGFYIRDVLRNPRMFHEFDYVRIKRNDLQYHGKNMEQHIAKDAFQKARKLADEVLEMLCKEKI